MKGMQRRSAARLWLQLGFVVAAATLLAAVLPSTRSATGATGTVAGAAQGDYLLPDLVSDPPTFDYGANVFSVGGQNRLLLRFDGYVTNLGDGPVDLSGNPQLTDSADPTSHDVWQRVRTASGEWVNLAQPPVRYETSDGHNHFHLMDIVAYSLWSQHGTTLVAPGAKVGFCLADSEELPEHHPNPGPATYLDDVTQDCMANEPNATSLHMGVTEGWRDIYDGDVTFQWIDVSDVGPGRYRLGVEADPYNILIETDETNNGVALSDDVSVVPGYVAKSKVLTGEPDTNRALWLATKKYGNPGTAAFRIVSRPSHGTLATKSKYTAIQGGIRYSAFKNRNVVYTPDPGFSGVDTFEVIAFDSARPDFPTSPAVATVTIDMTSAEAVVTIIDAPPSIPAGTTTSLQAQVDGAAAGVSWSVDGTGGGNATVGTIDADGTYTAPSAVPEADSVTIRATSTAAPSAFAETAMTITEAPNTAPSVTSPGNQSFNVGDSVDVHVAAIDAQRDPLTWNVDMLPAGLALVAQTGRIVGNPTISGTTQSRVTVSDGKLSTSITVSWNISPQETLRVPDKPAGLSEVSASPSSVVLSWDDPGDGSITGYQIWRRDIAAQPAGTFTSIADDTASSSTSYTDATVEAGTRYAYRIVAINAAGTSPKSKPLGVRTPAAPAPDKPAGLSEVSASPSSVVLSWDDPGDGSITGYQIWRRDIAAQPAGTFTSIADDTASSSTSYTDATVEAGTRYAYRIVAINAAGTSPKSKPLGVRTPAAPAPDKPAGLSEVSASHSSVVLSWDDPGDGSITGYQIWRRDIAAQPAGTFTSIADDTASSSTSYTDATVEAGTRYAYRIVAINAAGTSPKSKPLGVRTPVAPQQQG